MRLAINNSGKRSNITFFKKSVRIGFIDLHLRENSLELWSFTIYTKYRSKGLGTKAIGKIVKMFPDKKLWLMVEKDNPHAISIYKKHGFVIVNDRPDKLVYIMTKN